MTLLSQRLTLKWVSWLRKFLPALWRGFTLILLFYWQDASFQVWERLCPGGHGWLFQVFLDFSFKGSHHGQGGFSIAFHFFLDSPPQCLVSDNAHQFTSRKYRNFCFGLGINHVTTSPYYPKLNFSECYNRNLKTTLVAYHHDDHASWDKQQDWLQFVLSTARHEAHREAPFHLLFGFVPNITLYNV